MSIDTKELRFAASKSIRDLALLPSEVIELLDRLEAAEQTVQDHLRIDGEKARIAQRLEAAEKEREIDEERIADLMADLNRVGHENDALRAKIAEMERQEPVKYERRIKRRSEHIWGLWRECNKADYDKAKAVVGHCPKFSDDLFDYEMRPLYTFSGAQGEKK